jgi:predicted enzyme related to lactoylglutathione lyase
MTVGIRKPGQFSWTNILTPNPAEARAFYEKVLGWTFLDMPGVGYRFQVGGKDAGGLFDVVNPQTGDVAAPIMAMMIKVDDADATVAKVRALGGTAQDPFDVFDAGRMAVCGDPAGAKFDIWQAKAQPGASHDSAAHGGPSWIENLTTDPARVADFYAKLFGWDVQLMPMGAFDYTTFSAYGEPVAGLMPILPHMGDGKLAPQWGVYVTVTDVDAAARAVGANGGSVCVPMQDVPGVGRFCGVVSPHGVMFYLITYRM